MFFNLSMLQNVFQTKTNNKVLSRFSSTLNFSAIRKSNYNFRGFHNLLLF